MEAKRKHHQCHILYIQYHLSVWVWHSNTLLLLPQMHDCDPLSFCISCNANITTLLSIPCQIIQSASPFTAHWPALVLHLVWNSFRLPVPQARCLLACTASSPCSVHSATACQPSTRQLNSSSAQLRNSGMSLYH